MRKHAIPLFSYFALLLVATDALAVTATSSLPWKDGAAVADGWSMSAPAVSTAYKYALTAGTGVTDGMAGPQALFLTAARAPQLRSLERHVPLAAWRGKRLRVALRLKNEDHARGYASFSISNSDGSKLVPAGPARTRFHQDVWDTTEFVVDVPGNADDLVIHASLSGPGTVWIDGPMMGAADKDDAPGATRVIPAPQSGTDTAPPAIVPPGPGAVAVGGDWHPKNGFRGAAFNLYMGTTARIRLQAGDASLSGDATLHADNASIEPQLSFARFGGLENDVALEAWRDKRVRVTLRLKNQDGARAFAVAQVNRVDGDGSRTLAQRNAPEDGDWQTHQFVMDVPDDGSHLYVYAGFTGKGAIQVEGLTLEAVDTAAPLSPALSVNSGGPLGCIGGCGAVDYYVGNNNTYNNNYSNFGSGYNAPTSQAMSDPHPPR